MNFKRNINEIHRNIFITAKVMINRFKKKTKSIYKWTHLIEISYKSVDGWLERCRPSLQTHFSNIF